MSISNGYDESVILPKLQERKGWRQSTKNGALVLNTANLTCKSGKPFQDHHPACTVEVFMQTQEDPALVENAINANALLLAKTQSACMEAVSSVFVEPQLIDKTALLFTECIDSSEQTIPNAGKFVAYMFNVAPNDFMAQATSVALYFNGVATFNLYLFHSKVLAPLKTIEVTTVANSQTIVALETSGVADWYMRSSAATTKGGYFYIGYFQDDLGSVKAIDISPEWNCKTMSYGFTPIETLATGATTFDRTNVSETSYTYGINLEVSGAKDYTNMIVANASLFDELIGDIGARNMIDQAVNSYRNNAEQRQAGSMLSGLLADLNLDEPNENQPFVRGLKASIKSQIATLRKTFFPKPQITVTSPSR